MMQSHRTSTSWAIMVFAIIFTIAALSFIAGAANGENPVPTPACQCGPDCDCGKCECNPDAGESVPGDTPAAVVPAFCRRRVHFMAPVYPLAVQPIIYRPAVYAPPPVVVQPVVPYVQTGWVARRAFRPLRTLFTGWPTYKLHPLYSPAVSAVQAPLQPQHKEGMTTPGTPVN